MIPTACVLAQLARCDVAERSQNVKDVLDQFICLLSTGERPPLKLTYGHLRFAKPTVRRLRWSKCQAR